MPNWCSNSIHISGPKDKITALWEKAKEKEGLLEAMAPIGEWQYGEACETWGTKWDVSLEGLELIDEGDTASITGFAESAWSPPVQAFEFFCNKNDDVTAELTYFEPGIGFIGRWDNESGEDYYDIDPDNLEDIPEDLREEYDLENWYNEEEEEDSNEDEP